MRRMSALSRSFALLGALVLFVIAGGGAFAVADDYLAREVLPAGATVAGIDVGGLTRTEARAVITTGVAEPLGQPVTVIYEDRQFTLDAGQMVTVDVDAMVEDAFRPRAAAFITDRVVDRALDRPVGGVTEVALSIDEQALAAWLDGVAAQVETTATDATLTVDVNRLVLVRSSRGVDVDHAATLASLREALAAGTKSVPLAVTFTEPALTEQDLGPAIVVDISERRLYLYEHGVLAKEYGVAVGTPSHPTPRGDFQITLKRYMPTWVNPGSAWAADMPRSIPPGPSNPLGTRALNLDAPGIRIHGTSADYSIGTAASHGCMRMHRWDIEDLYERVDVGTPVHIVR